MCSQTFALLLPVFHSIFASIPSVSLYCVARSILIHVLFTCGTLGTPMRRKVRVLTFCCRSWRHLAGRTSFVVERLLSFRRVSRGSMISVRHFLLER